MKITIQINKYSVLSVPVSSIPEAQLIFREPEMQSLMKNPTKLTSYLELNDPSFYSITLEYFATEDDEKYKEDLKTFQLSTKVFQQYLAHCFEIPEKHVMIEI